MSKKEEYLQALTDRLVEQIKDNKAPWQRPFEAGSYIDIMPVNSKGTAYKGTNMLNLMLIAEAKGYSDNRWLTFNAAKELGATVKKGEKGSDIFFYKFPDSETVKDNDGKAVLDENGKPIEEMARPIIVWSKVFNADQIEGLPPREHKEVKPLEEWERHEAAERILKASGVEIIHKAGERAYYSPIQDHIVLPERSQFKTNDLYYATALHELGHATGHETRLNRDLSGAFGSESYAKEELRAEIASMTIGQELQIGHDPSQHIAYLQSWANVVQNDPKEIFRAVKDADAIHQFVLSLDPERAKTVQEDLEQVKTGEIQEQVKVENLNVKTFINVPFAEKNEAKALGAKWDKDNKSWYIPTGEDQAKFTKWLNAPDSSKGERTYIYTIPEDKDTVKALGAKYDKESQVWYIPSGEDQTKFKQWLDRPDIPTPQEEFANFLRDRQIVVKGEHPKMDGKTHRLNNDGSDQKNVLYQLYPNDGGVPSGRVTNFSRDGVPEKWVYPMEYIQRQQNIDAVERAKYGANYKPEPVKPNHGVTAPEEKLEPKQNLDKEEIYNKTAERVEALFKIAPVANQHDYLARKAVGANDVARIVPDAKMLPPELSHDIAIANDWRQAKFLRENNPENKMIVQKGSLIIPQYNQDGALRSFETIGYNGAKYALKDGEKNGLSLKLGNVENGKPFIVAEGYATGATFKEQANIPVVITFGKGNLVDVAKELREHYPDSKIYFAADNDHENELKGKGNGGVEDATKAAEAINGHVLIPQFKQGDTGKDWNDIFVDKGLAEFRNQLKIQLEKINGVSVGKDEPAKIDKINIDFGTLSHAQQKPIRNFIHVLEERLKDNPVQLQQSLQYLQSKIPDIASGKISLTEISQSENKEMSR